MLPLHHRIRVKHPSADICNVACEQRVCSFEFPLMHLATKTSFNTCVGSFCWRFFLRYTICVFVAGYTSLRPSEGGVHVHPTMGGVFGAGRFVLGICVQSNSLINMLSIFLASSHALLRSVLKLSHLQVCRGFYLCARDPELWHLVCAR